MELSDIYEKVDYWVLEKVLLLCSEERYDVSDGLCINEQNWYCNG